jgi:hypothetical protein
MTTKLLSIADLRTDGGTQLRVRIDDDHVADLAAVYADKKTADSVPPVEVLFDSIDYWVWDGHHRILAAKKAGRNDVKCHVDKGTQTDAILKAAGANQKHGLRRSYQDKRRAVGALLAIPKWAKSSTNWLAKACGVGWELADDVRKATTPRQVLDREPETVEGEDGKHYKSRRKRRKPDLPDPDSFPEADATEADTADPSSSPAAEPESAQAPAPADRGGVPSDSGFEAFYRDLTEWCASEIKRVGRPLVASWLLGASERMMRE